DITVKQDGDDTYIFIEMPKDINGNVTVTVGGKDYIVDIVNGSGVLVLSGLPAGEYTVVVYFDGNEYYANNTASTVFKISKKPDVKPGNDTNDKIKNVENSNLKTGNPLLLLLLVLFALPIRRFLKK
ncbi:MAG: Ig-like domain repeat protein, partial [Methanobrevibacter sp.]|nr:Ig-like domain repeat protein [Methanobrevibacter sp.]